MDVDIGTYRATVGLNHANKSYSPTQKNRFFILFWAFKTFQFELLALVLILFQVVFSCVFRTFITFYKKATPTSTIIFLLTVKKILRHGNPICLIPAITLILSLFGIFYFMKKSLKHAIRKEPHANLLLDAFILEITLTYHYRWAKHLHNCGDIHQNPGPNPKIEHLKAMHWNLNSLKAHNFERLHNLNVYNAIYKFHIIAITETALTNKIDDKKIEIEGYDIARYDLINEETHGGALIYFRQDLSVKQRTDLNVPTYTIVLELSISRKKVFCIVTYRKFSQTTTEFETYLEKLNEIMEKISLETPYCTFLLGDVNGHNKKWYQGDKSDKFGLSIQETFDNFGFTQMVKQPTYLTNNSETLVDIFATNQPNLVTANEIHPSQHDKCHHQVNFVKINLKCIAPDPIKRFIWHYSRGDFESMRRSALQFDWENTLSHLNPDDQVNFFDETILNIAKNYIPCEHKTFYPKDPPWITKACKDLYQKYKRKYKSFAKKGFLSSEKKNIDGLKKEYSELVQKEKDRYTKSLGSAVSDPRTGQKNTGRLLKNF